MRRLLAVLLTAALATSAVAADPHRADTGERVIRGDARLIAGPFNRFYSVSVGSDYAANLSREANLHQLRTAVDELKFRSVRMHAIFHDDMGVFKRVDGKPVYDWTRIDALYDRLLQMGIRPFVELGFTPRAMASSAQTVFHWEGNTSHPDPVLWVGLVEAFVKHLRARYGAEEVKDWYFEVWNEPDLPNFWERADATAYFELYDRTARAIKAIDPRIRVGGPATSGQKFIAPFLAFTAERKTPLDFISFHNYGVADGYLDLEGKTDYKLATEVDSLTNLVIQGYRTVKASSQPHLPILLTEFNASWVHRDPLLDTYLVAPFILNKVQQNRGLLTAMSFWTYSDLFEEVGPPPASFHGGFGLMNREGIRKSSWFAYKYLAQLHDHEIRVDDADAFVTQADDGRLAALVWDYQPAAQTLSNRSTHLKPFPAKPARTAVLQLDGVRPGVYTVAVHRTGYRANDAYTAYLDMGAPKDLSPAQVEQLHALTGDRPESSQRVTVAADGRLRLPVPMRANDVVLLRLSRQ